MVKQLEMIKQIPKFVDSLDKKQLEFMFYVLHSIVTSPSKTKLNPDSGHKKALAILYLYLRASPEALKAYTPHGSDV